MNDFDLFIRKNPFLKLLSPLLLGILLSSFIQVNCNILFISILLLLAAYTILATTKLQRTPLFQYTGTLIPFLLFFFFGIFLFQTHIPHECKHTQLNNTIARIELEAQEKKNTHRYILSFTRYDSIKHKNNLHKCLAYIQKQKNNEALNIGDLILFSGKMQKIENNGLPGEFDFKSFMKHKGVLYQIYLDSNSWVNTNKWEAKWPFRQASLFRKELIKIIDNSEIETKNAALLKAMLLGKKDALDGSVKESFSVAGAMHVLAVSGMHVGIIFGILNLLLSFMRGRKLKAYKISIIILCIWAYAFITGLSASVVRAAFMFSLMSGKSFTKRSADIFNALFASAFIMLIIDPNYLWDLGFILSYSAVLGILVFFPEINSLLQFNSYIPKTLWEVSVIGIAAQLGTIPVVAFYFQRIPTYFIITNFWLLLFTFAIMSLGFIFLCLSFIPILKYWLGFLTNEILDLFQSGVKVIANFPGSSLGLSANLWQVFLIIVFVSFLFILLRYRKSYAILCGLSILCLFQFTKLSEAWENKKTYRIISGKINKSTFVYIQKKQTSKCFHNSSDSSEFFLRSISQLNKHYGIKQAELTNISGHLQKQKGMLSLSLPENKKITWLNSHEINQLISPVSLKQNYILLDGIKPSSFEAIHTRIHAKHVLLNWKLHGITKNKTETYYREQGISSHNFAEKQCFIEEIQKKGERHK